MATAPSWDGCRDRGGDRQAAGGVPLKHLQPLRRRHRLPTPDKTIAAVRNGTVSKGRPDPAQRVRHHRQHRQHRRLPAVRRHPERFEHKVGKPVVSALTRCGRRCRASGRCASATTTSPSRPRCSFPTLDLSARRVRPASAGTWMTTVDRHPDAGPVTAARLRILASLALGEADPQPALSRAAGTRVLLHLGGRPTPIAHDGEVGAALTHARVSRRCIGRWRCTGRRCDGPGGAAASGGLEGGLRRVPPHAGQCGYR